MNISVLSLFVVETAARLLSSGLEVAAALGLPVTSWRAGDPTRAAFKFLAEALAERENVTSEYIKAGFLSTATGAWLTVLASEVYGVDRVESTYATPTVTLRNDGGGYYDIDAGDITLSASSSGKTYRSTSGGVLSPGATLVVDLTADEPGSDSTVSANEIDELVTSMLGVVIVSSTAAIGLDEESDESLKDRCSDTLGALSPNGPADAYESVARNPLLTGVTDITRATSTSDATDGTVTIYIASPSGPCAGASVTAAQNAVERWATPLCVTPTVVNATAFPVNMTVMVSGNDIPPTFEDDIESALVKLFGESPIGVVVPHSLLVSVTHELMVSLGASRVAVHVSILFDPVPVGLSQVPVLGTLIVSEV
jgi:hypothetical protein